MRFAVVIEKAESNYSAYVPDLPGCVDDFRIPAQLIPKSGVESVR